MREGWTETPLGDLVKIRKGISYRSSELGEEGEGVPFINLKCVSRGGGFEPSGLKRFTGEVKDTQWVKEGDLLIANTDLTRGMAVLGSPLLVPSLNAEERACISLDLSKLEVDEDRASLPFIFLTLQHPAARQFMKAHSSGTTVIHLKVNEVPKLPIILPPLAVQRRVVDLIWAVDEVASGAQAALDASRSAVRMASAELVRWESPDTPLGELVSIESKLVDPTTDEYRDLPHVGVEKIVAGTGELLPLSSAASDGVTSGKHLFGNEDVIYSKIRPELRKAVLPDFIGLCSADAYPLRPGDRILRDYLFEVILSDGFSQRSIAKSGRTKMPKINRSELFSIQVEVPDLADQQLAVSVIGGLRDQVAALRSLTEGIEGVRKALLSDLLSGAHEIPNTYDSLLEMAS